MFLLFFFLCLRLTVVALKVVKLVNAEGANGGIFVGKLKWKCDINRVNMTNTSIRLEKNSEKQTNNETFFPFELRQELSVFFSNVTVLEMRLFPSSVLHHSTRSP